MSDKRIRNKYIVIVAGGVTQPVTFPNREHISKFDLETIDKYIKFLKNQDPDRSVYIAELTQVFLDEL